MCSLLLLSILLLHFLGTDTPGQTTLAGTYKYGGKNENSAFGEALIYPNDNRSFSFYLDLNRGAPSFNMGQLYGRAFLQANKTTWLYQNSDTTKNNRCALTFSFDKGNLVIKTLSDKDDCGFGYGVLADGTYRQSKKSIPTYFITPTEDTVYFKKVTPEVYNQD